LDDGVAADINPLLPEAAFAAARYHFAEQMVTIQSLAGAC
jgi:hypothetical protein